MKSACRKNYQIFRHTIFRRILRACLFCLLGRALLPPREATLSKLTMMGLTLVCGIAASAHRELLRPVAEIRQPTFNRAALAAQYRHGRASPRVFTREFPIPTRSTVSILATGPASVLPV